jgi:AcrR family transcriptional regulator
MSRRFGTTEETRAAILTAAEELFRRVGYAKTAVADIAEVLRMSSANIYRYFPSKSAINNAICDRLMATLEIEMQAAVARPGTAAARLRDLILTLNRRHRELFTRERRVHDMVEAAMAENWASIEAHISTSERFAADLIRDGIATGEFGPGDAEALGTTVIGACCSLLHPTVIAQCTDETEYERDAERVVWLLIEALRNPNRSAMP